MQTPCEYNVNLISYALVKLSSNSPPHKTHLHQRLAGDSQESSHVRKWFHVIAVLVFLPLSRDLSSRDLLAVAASLALAIFMGMYSKQVSVSLTFVKFANILNRL